MTIRSTISTMVFVLAFVVYSSAEAAHDSSTTVPPSRKVDSLKSVYARWFDIGAAIPGVELNDAERQLMFRHFTAVTSENCMKPKSLHPAEDRFDFVKADALVNMALANGLKVNGHTLLWHQQCPDWFFMDGDKPAVRALVLKRMRLHIAAVAGHFAGKVASWDVVNEAIDDGKEYMRETKWFTAIGEDFIAEAFTAANKADPKAELYYNDYSIEYPDKRAKVLRLIRELKARKVHIDGIGIQGHWQLDQIPYKEIEEALIAFHAEGLKVMITELDIDVVTRRTTGADTGAREQTGVDPFAKGLPAEIQKRLADQYASLFSLFLKHSDKITRVTFWGLHDGRSWLNNWPNKRTNHPLLWDRNLQSKPAMSAVMALQSQSTQSHTSSGRH